MIKIEILKSLDPELIGEHLFFYDFISIGPTNNDRIFIEAKFSNNEKFRLCFKVFSQEKISIYCLPKTSFYLSQKKKIAGTKLHIKNDIIEYKELKVKILEFMPENNGHKANKIEDCNNNDLIEALEIEFLYLEKVLDASI